MKPESHIIVSTPAMMIYSSSNALGLLLSCIFVSIAVFGTPNIVHAQIKRDSLYEQGRMLYFTRQYDSASAHFEQIVAADRSDIAAFNELGWAYLASGQYVAGMNIVTEATLTPSKHLEELYYLLSQLYYRNFTTMTVAYQLDNRTQEEIAGYIARMHEFEAGAEELFNLALTYQRRREFDKALDVLEKVFSMGGYPGAHFVLADIYGEQKKHNESAIAYLKALVYSPVDAGTPRNLLWFENELLSKDSTFPHPLMTIETEAGPLIAALYRLSREESATDSLAQTLYMDWLRVASDRGLIEPLIHQVLASVGVEASLAWIGEHPDEYQLLQEWIGAE